MMTVNDIRITKKKKKKPVKGLICCVAGTLLNYKRNWKILFLEVG